LSQKWHGTPIAIHWVETQLMQTSRIPWQIFFDALVDQSYSKREGWLVRWRFGNEGVYVDDRKNGFRREPRTGYGSIHLVKGVPSSKSKWSH
jgi:hypothetical protein